MEINVDLSNVPELDALPEGEYLVQVAKVDVTDSKRTPGNKNLALEFVVQDGEHHGKKVFDVLSLSDKALWRVRDFVNACGLYPGPAGFKTEELLGQKLIVGLATEQRMQQDPNSGQLVPVPGKMRNKVAGYKAAA